jgi:hypothetical protein
LNDATFFLPPENVFAPRTRLDAEVSAVKAKLKMFLEKITQEKYLKEKNRNRTVCARKRTVCAPRGCAEKFPYPNIGTHARVKMFRFGLVQFGCRRVDTPSPLINNRWT